MAMVCIHLTLWHVCRGGESTAIGWQEVTQTLICSCSAWIKWRQVAALIQYRPSINCVCRMLVSGNNPPPPPPRLRPPLAGTPNTSITPVMSSTPPPGITGMTKNPTAAESRMERAPTKTPTAMASLSVAGSVLLDLQPGMPKRRSCWLRELRSMAPAQQLRRIWSQNMPSFPRTSESRSWRCK
jgi:hypothetical protein